jgi:hypothetical protein
MSQILQPCIHYEPEWVKHCGLSEVQKGQIGEHFIADILEAIVLRQELLCKRPILVGQYPKPNTSVYSEYWTNIEKADNPDIYAEGYLYGYLFEIKNLFPTRTSPFYKNGLGEAWAVKKILEKNWFDETYPILAGSGKHTVQKIQITKPVVRIAIVSCPVFKKTAEQLIRTSLNELIIIGHPMLPEESDNHCYGVYHAKAAIDIRQLLYYYEHQRWKWGRKKTAQHDKQSKKHDKKSTSRLRKSISEISD